MKIWLTLILLAFAGFAQADENIFPASDPHNSGNWVLNKSVSDEFNGDSLDSNKWNNLGAGGNDFGEWKGRAPSQYDPANVQVVNGSLVITSKWDPTFKFSPTKCSNGMTYGRPAPVTTAAIISKSKFKYGYMETRCKAADGPVSSSFWTTGQGGEIDVFEHYGENSASRYSATRLHASFHDWRKGSSTFGKRIWTNDHQLGFRVADDFHVYGLQWDENFVSMFVDGRLVNCVTKQEMGEKWVASNEQKIWFDSETFDWEVQPANLKQSDFGDGQKFIVDYCRIWQSSQASNGCETRTNLVANSGFEDGMHSWQGSTAASMDAHEGQSAAVLKTGGMIEQTVRVQPNTTYILSAWAKSPDTNERNLWFNAFLGVKGHGAENADARFFMPYYQQKSVQFTTGPSSTTAIIFFTNKPHGKPAFVDRFELVEAAAP